MLAPADAALARRDRAIPGLATVLDPEALRERLRDALPAACIGPLSTAYVRYKPATSCLVGFRVGENGEELTGHAKALARGDVAKLGKVARRGGRAAARRPKAPLLDEALVGVAFRLARWPLRAPRGRLPLHGDLSIDQVLLTAEGGAALIDLDEAVLGDPTSDLARFAADLRRRAIAGELTNARVDRLVADLGHGYAAALRKHLAPPRPASLACHTAAWPVRLAPEPFRCREADWHAQTAAILAAARECRDAR